MIILILIFFYFVNIKDKAGVYIMRKMPSQKGMTLIEILISIAILGIIVVSFSGVFVQGFSTIFSMGNRTRAMTKAQTVIDMAIQGGSSALATSLSGVSDKSDDEANFNTYESAKAVKHLIESQTFNLTEGGVTNTVTYTKLRVRVYYQNGKRYITLTSLIP